MTQNTPRPSLSRKAGRGFLRLLRGILGDRNVKRAADSVDVLRDEYARGRAEGEDPPPPRAIPHREVEPPT